MRLVDPVLRIECLGASRAQFQGVWVDGAVIRATRTGPPKVSSSSSRESMAIGAGARPVLRSTGTTPATMLSPAPTLASWPFGVMAIPEGRRCP